MASVVSLKRASQHFASTLEQPSCPAVHVRGHDHVCSCYDLENDIGVRRARGWRAGWAPSLTRSAALQLLVVYQEMEPEDVLQFDAEDMDNLLRQHIPSISAAVQQLLGARKK